VLANILPGLREIRGPLAAGFLWLLLGWLSFHDRVASPSGAIGELVDLGGLVSDAALAVAASFVAYLIGSFSEDVFGRALTKMVRQSLEAPSSPDELHTETPFQAREFSFLVTRWEEMSERFRESELARLENESDRKRAERDLRIAILPPITALIVYLAVTDSWWWALALVIVPALAVQAWLRTSEYLFATMTLRELRRRAGVPPASVTEAAIEAKMPPEPELGPDWEPHLGP
jgi:hypothetical protein